jgi:hypothetical protein
MQTSKTTRPSVLIEGDAFALALMTAVGFATHGELASAGLRMLTTFIPLCIAWALIAPWLEVYRLEIAGQPRQIWRPVLAAFLAAPLAAWLRSLLLQGTLIIPVFVLVLGATSAFAILLWRVVWLFWLRMQVKHG